MRIYKFLFERLSQRSRSGTSIIYENLVSSVALKCLEERVPELETYLRLFLRPQQLEHVVCRQHNVVLVLIKCRVNVLLQLVEFFILDILQMGVYNQRVLLHLVLVL